MTEIASLVRWLVTYSVGGGLLHFIGCYLIIVAIARIFRFVRVDVKTKKRAAKSDKASG